MAVGRSSDEAQQRLAIELDLLAGLNLSTSEVKMDEVFAHNLSVPIMVSLGEIVTRKFRTEMRPGNSEVVQADLFERQEWHMEPVVLASTKAPCLSAARARNWVCPSVCSRDTQSNAAVHRHDLLSAVDCLIKVDNRDDAKSMQRSDRL